MTDKRLITFSLPVHVIAFTNLDDRTPKTDRLQECHKRQRITFVVALNVAGVRKSLFAKVRDAGDMPLTGMSPR